MNTQMNAQETTTTITVIIGSLQEIGGTERHLVAILPLLKAEGWNIQVFALFKKGVMADRLEAKGIPVELILPSTRFLQYPTSPKRSSLPKRLFRLLIAVCTLTKRLKKLQSKMNSKNTSNNFYAKDNYSKNIYPNSNNNANNNDTVQLLHFFLPEPYIIGMWAAFFAGFKGLLIMSRRSVNEYQKRRWGSAFVEKMLHPKTALVMGNSQAIMNDLQKEGIPENKLKLIYNGIDLTPFNNAKPRHEVRKANNINDEDLTIIMVANLLFYKGHSDLLKALAQIKNQLPINWHMLCVGRDDGLGETLKQQSQALGLHNYVQWLGIRNDIADLLLASDIGILCSHEEGFSNAVVEGMAASLPMIVTDVGGNAEAVIHNETGLVVQPHNPHQLAEALLSLVQNPTLAKQMGEAGRMRALEQFSMKACVDAYDETYQTLIKNHYILNKYR